MGQFAPAMRQVINGGSLLPIYLKDETFASLAQALVFSRASAHAAAMQLHASTGKRISPKQWPEIIAYFEAEEQRGRSATAAAPEQQLPVPAAPPSPAAVAGRTRTRRAVSAGDERDQILETAFDNAVYRSNTLQLLYKHQAERMKGLIARGADVPRELTYALLKTADAAGNADRTLVLLRDAMGTEETETETLTMAGIAGPPIRLSVTEQGEQILLVEPEDESALKEDVAGAMLPIWEPEID